MSVSPASLGLTLGIAPTTRGFSWVAFSSPLSIYDWGSMYARSDKNLRSVEYFEALLDRLQPELIVLEESSSRVFRSRRVLELHQLLKSSGYLAQIEVAAYGREQVQGCFATLGAGSQQEIAEAISRRFPGLAHKLPRRRAAWDGEDRRMALFAAIALVMTHFHIEGGELTEGLKHQA